METIVMYFFRWGVGVNKVHCGLSENGEQSLFQVTSFSAMLKAIIPKQLSGSHVGVPSQSCRS